MSDSLVVNWLTRLHDSGDPDWRVTAYEGQTFEGRFANRILQITSLKAATNLRDPWAFFPQWGKVLYLEAQKRANVKGTAFELSKPAMLRIIWRSEGRCEVSGLPFDMTRLARGRRRPFAPSLDRVLSSDCYRFGNVRLVSMIANIAMNEWGSDPLITLSRAIAAREETGGNRQR